MKKQLLLLLLIMPFCVQSKNNWNKVINDQHLNLSLVLDQALFQDSIIIVAGQTNNATCSNTNLFAYNNSGKRLWSIDGDHRAITTDSDFIYTVGGYAQLDHDDFDVIVFSKYTKDGEEVFSISYQGFYKNTALTGISISSEGKVFIELTSSLLLSSKDGVPITKMDISSPMSDFDVLNSKSTPYVFSDQNKLYSLDANFNESNQQNFSDDIKKILTVKDTIYLLFNEYVLVLDSNINTIDSIASGLSTFENIDNFDDHIWIQQSSDSISIVRLANGNIVDTLNFPKYVENPRFVFSEKEFTFIGNTKNDQIGLYHLENQYMNFLLDQDIVLVDFDIIDVQDTYREFSKDSTKTGYNFNTQITVKNLGSETIHSLAVYLRLNGSSNCGNNFLYEKLTGIEILPGETKKMPLNRRGYQDGFDDELCFEILSPNDAIELNIGNNSLCKSKNINGINTESMMDFSVYPNPVSNYLFINNADQTLEKIEVIDLNGRSVYSTEVIENLVKINMDSVDTGLYTLLLFSTNGIVYELIMKE